MRSIRLSSKARTPRSVLVRIRRPKPCLSGEDRLRHLKFGEGVAAVFVEGIDTRGDDGIAGNGKGQTVDDDAGELVAGNVNTLPKAGSGEQDRARSVLEALQQDGAWRGTLQQQGKFTRSRTRSNKPFICA